MVTEKHQKYNYLQCLVKSQSIPPNSFAKSLKVIRKKRQILNFVIRKTQHWQFSKESSQQKTSRLHVNVETPYFLTSSSQNLFLSFSLHDTELPFSLSFANIFPRQKKANRHRQTNDSQNPLQKMCSLGVRDGMENKL